MVGQLLSDQRTLARGRHEERDVPACAARGGQRGGDRRRLRPHEQPGRAGPPGAQDLRRHVERRRRERDSRRDRLRVRAERLRERLAPLLAVPRVVDEQGELQPLRDGVLRQPEGDPPVRRRDPEDVSPRVRVDQLDRRPDTRSRSGRSRPGLVRHDASTPVPSSTIASAPSCDRSAHIAGGAGRREGVVHLLDADRVPLVAGHDPPPVRLVGGELRAAGDRLAELRRPRERGVHDHEQRAAVLLLRAAAAGEHGSCDGGDEKREGAAHGQTLETSVAEVRTSHLRIGGHLRAERRPPRPGRPRAPARGRRSRRCAGCARRGGQRGRRRGGPPAGRRGGPPPRRRCPPTARPRAGRAGARASADAIISAR